MLNIIFLIFFPLFIMFFSLIFIFLSRQINYYFL
nr:MAG TPA: hypothetical protein [Caudoviricetes sp.]